MPVAGWRSTCSLSALHFSGDEDGRIHDAFEESKARYRTLSTLRSLLMSYYVIDMAGNEALTIITAETRNLRALSFQITEDQLSTGKEWGDGLEAIEREFRYFKLSDTVDKKDAPIIYGGK